MSECPHGVPLFAHCERCYPGLDAMAERDAPAEPVGGATLRTDAAAFNQNDGTTRYSTTTGAPLKVVSVDFARQLERELIGAIQATFTLKERAEKAEREVAEWKEMYNDVIEELAALKEPKND